MSELQINRWDRLVRRLGNIVGARSIVTTALEDVFPVLDMENMPLENKVLAGSFAANASTVLAASALNFSLIELFNPDGSGILVTLEQVIMSTSGDEVRFTVDLNARGIEDSIKAYRDIRRTAPPVCQVRSLQQVANLASPTIRVRPAATLKTTTLSNNGNDLFVFPPGTGISAQTDGINEGLTITWLWRERIFEASELNI